MYARVVAIKMQPGKKDELVSLHRDSFVPDARQQEGFKGAYLLTDSYTNRAIAISFWETEADMKAHESAGFYHKLLMKVANVFAEPASLEHYEVDVHE